MKKYAIFNPLNGQYSYVENIEECQQIMANTAYNFYVYYSNNNPLSIVEYFEDGSEKWSNSDGTTVEITKEMKDLIANNEFIASNTL